MKKPLTEKQIQQILHNLTKGMPKKWIVILEVTDDLY